jgi:hypothetical protein
VGRFDHLGQKLLQLLVGIDADHLCTWNHDVAHLHLGDLQRPFDDADGIGIQLVALLGGMQMFEQGGAPGRGVAQQPEQTRQQWFGGLLGGAVHGVDSMWRL